MEQELFYFTVQGDTLDSIAKKFYGNELLFPLLLQANPHVMGVVIFSANERLLIPPLTQEEEQQQDLPPWRLKDE